MSTTLTFSIFAVIFLATGIVLYVMSDQIEEIVVQYDNVAECEDVKQKYDDNNHPLTCEVDLLTDNASIENTIKSPIYVYYQLDNFYQNHRRYVKSRDNEQLYGTYKSSDQLSTCDPIVNNTQLWKEQQYSFKDQELAKANNQPLTDFVPLPANSPAVPCGLVAKSFFNDTYSLCKCPQTDPCDCNFATSPQDKVEINRNNIAWSSDVEYKFKNLEDIPAEVGATWQEVQWLDMENGKYLNFLTLLEHFIVWMRTAGLPNFRKLWGKIETDLESARYKVVIENNYAVDTF